MNISILVPHFKEGRATAYAISQLLKYKGKHDVEIIVIDNSNDSSVDYLFPFRGQVQYMPYKEGKLQSHGVAFDYALSLNLVDTEYFITMESDSFPTKDNWLDSYERLIDNGFDSAGSLLKLSGGQYVHPAGALYKKSIWQECKDYCDKIPYDYFPNMGMKEGFACHVMLRKDKTEQIVKEAGDYMELAEGYIGISPEQIMAKAEYYSPTKNPFHNGMGTLQESIKTYGFRDVNSGKIDVLIDDKQPIVYRIGYEPGQFICYWQLAMNKKIALIPTELKWMPNRGGQQQEYTLMDNGFKHIWCGSSYLGMAGGEINDVYEFKKNQIERLYDSLPENQKI